MASLADVGYVVNMNAADPYAAPAPVQYTVDLPRWTVQGSLLVADESLGRPVGWGTEARREPSSFSGEDASERASAPALTGGGPQGRAASVLLDAPHVEEFFDRHDLELGHLASVDALTDDAVTPIDQLLAACGNCAAR